MNRKQENNIFWIAIVILTLFFFFTMIKCDARDWSKVTKAIAKIESNNNPRAVNGDAVGLLQIRPILVRDINRILKKRNINRRYTLTDRYNPRKSREMFEIYQSYYNPKGNIERAIRLWNGGSGYTKNRTERYYRKVRSEIK